MNNLYKLINSISNRAFISNNELTNKIRLIKAQASEVLRVIEVIDIAKSRDIRLNKEH